MDVKVETETGLPPVSAVLSRESDNVVVLYGDSNDDTWHALAFKTNQINRRIQRITNLPTLGPGETLDFGYFGENGHSADVTDAGPDVLRVGDDREETVIEVGVAINPDGVLVGVENPADATVTGVIDADRLRGYGPDNPNGEDFTDFGAVKSDVTKTKQGVPTTALSPTPDQGLFRFDKAVDERNNIYFGFLNTREDDAALEALAWGASYRVSVIEDSATVKDMVFGRGYNRRILTYGGLENVRPKRPDNYTNAQVQLTASDVRSVVGGGSGGGA